MLKLPHPIIEQISRGESLGYDKLNIAIIKTENVDMKIAKVPQPWASLVMTEIIEYIMPIPDIRQDAGDTGYVV